MEMNGEAGLSTRTASDSIGELGDSRLALTKNDEEPNGIKLSPKQSQNREVIKRLVSEFTITSPFDFP
jgi:hypothetical protein